MKFRIDKHMTNLYNFIIIFLYMFISFTIIYSLLFNISIISLFGACLSYIKTSLYKLNTFL